MLMITEYTAYDGDYHFVGTTKYRFKSFEDEATRRQLQQCIKDILARADIKLIVSAVAYDHIHVLVQTNQDPYKVGNLLFGGVSRAMRQTVLSESFPKALWGGTSCTAIADQEHLDNVIAYIARHQVDNSKGRR